MDDIIVLAKTRWHLRKALRRVNQHFNQLKIEQAPNKTFIGRIEKGGDYLSALKGNQSSLHDDVKLFFENTPKSHINRLNIHKTT
ncbi:MAG: hypothetical protein ACJAU1_001848, partial [Psychromonas sp.]